jgi:D-alanyl-D-alanine dipeptidase
MVILAVLLLTIAAANGQSAIDNCRQLLVMTADSWLAQTGQLKLFERCSDAPWRKRGSTIDVRLGRRGLAWGRGLFSVSSLAGPVKREGDDRAPAGMFRLGSVFGLGATTRMPFLAVSKRTVAVDDPSSRYYNRIVDESKINDRDWEHAEKLFGIDLYRLALVVEHNVPPTRGAGSCIFLHIWKNPETSTSGCTAMSNLDLVRIIRWLDPAKHPLLVQMPRPVYDTVANKWMLPTP